MPGWPGPLLATDSLVVPDLLSRHFAVRYGSGPTLSPAGHTLEREIGYAQGPDPGAAQTGGSCSISKEAVDEFPRNTRVLNPGAPLATGPPLSVVPDSLTAYAARARAGLEEGQGVTADVSSHVVGLWIDLVRQAGNALPAAIGPAPNGLSRQHLRALACLQADRLTMRALARSLGISSAAATVIADRLTSVGAVVRYRDSQDRRLVRVVITPVGVQLVSDYRCTQVATLEALLDEMVPARRAVLTRAMKELAGTMGFPRGAPSGAVLTVVPQPRTLN